MLLPPGAGVNARAGEFDSTALHTGYILVVKFLLGGEVGTNCPGVIAQRYGSQPKMRMKPLLDYGADVHAVVGVECCCLTRTEVEYRVGTQRVGGC